MIARLFSGFAVPAGSALAVAGLAAVAALTMPALPEAARLALRAILVLVWAAYAVQLGAGWPASEGKTARIIDILAVAVPPFGLVMARGGADPSILCGVWAVKLLRDLPAFRLVLRVAGNEARNLFGVLALFALILFAASLLAYLLEGAAQPEAFGSVPRAMWWAVTTLTTTGYGDAIPHSTLGRMLAGLVMMCGIGVFALMAGILATGFAEELRRQDFSRVWQLVAGVPLFAGLPHRDLAEIVRALKPRRLAPGAVICRKGQPGNEMYFILEGRVQVASASPVELGSGDYFGEMALVSGEPRFATVVAATPVSLLALHISDFQTLIERDSTLADTIRHTAEERRRSPTPGS
ncbi:MAG: cyclic nucleotide-binding domain-containing protein [Proteobacteria bacterium]|nr:cyclic nucleotide-binding domain-containing protein [Pseudomonadota bacterium]MBS0572096.1 cyclic nucleotide-binding domain-containing protein [Pseudomonadota bacterium]